MNSVRGCIVSSSLRWLRCFRWSLLHEAIPLALGASRGDRESATAAWSRGSGTHFWKADEAGRGRVSGSQGVGEEEGASRLEVQAAIVRPLMRTTWMMRGASYCMRAARLTGLTERRRSADGGLQVGKHRMRHDAARSRRRGCRC